MERQWKHTATRKDPEMYKFHNLLRIKRMKKSKKLGTHTKQEWLALIKICKNKCVLCKKSDNLSKDHIIAIYQGGSDSIQNIQPLCKPCNSSSSGKQIDYRPKNWKNILSKYI